MVDAKIILKFLPKVLKTVDIPKLGKKYQGKVRDFYIVGDKRVLITTDRQSAFDVNLGFIPYKGSVLNMLSAFWFGKTQAIVQNHLISTPDDNVMITHNLQPIPVEMVVRGYMSGVTKTSIWYSYEKGERTIYGLQFPEGMRKNQRLQRPIITPTTHPEPGTNQHDERLTKEEIISRNIVNRELYEKMEKVSFALFDFGSRWCEKQGLILVDTKYEFGLYNGELMLMDEIHTPDCSRFWIADTYEERFNKGEEPENFDKEFLRLWYAEKGYKGEGKPPAMSNQLIVDLAQRYIGVYEKISGQAFNGYQYPIEKRIQENVLKAVTVQ